MSLDADAYLARLDAPRPDSPSAEALRTLHGRHLRRVPFENLDIPLGVDLSLDLDHLADKIVGRRRGGFCYELNGLFAHLLDALGYEVTLLAASVLTGNAFGPPLDHLGLRVRCADGTEWLADVGFGAHSEQPLRWQTDVDQADPGGTFRLVEVGDGDIDLVKDGRIEYRLETHPRQLSDFAAMCWYQSHAPASHFTQGVVCSRSTSDGRVSLSGDRLIRTRHGERNERVLSDDDAVLAAYRDEFGVELDRVPRVATVR